MHDFLCKLDLSVTIAFILSEISSMPPAFFLFFFQLPCTSILEHSLCSISNKHFFLNEFEIVATIVFIVMILPPLSSELGIWLARTQPQN